MVSFTSSSTEVALPSSGLSAGKDYYVYLVNGGREDQKLIVSEYKSSPRDADISTYNWKQIGGFHTLCADVGYSAYHPLSGYKAGDILPRSVWCLNHRPHCSPEGMVYDPRRDLWVDIYLQSGKGEDTKSAYGVPITSNRSYTDHAKDMMQVKKRLLGHEDFLSAMYGSNENSSIEGQQAPTPAHSGGHKDTQERRMISHIGCEDGYGYVSQYLSEFFPVPNQSDPSKSDMHVLIGGGSWQDGAECGSFFRQSVHSRNFTDEKVGARGCCRPRRFI
ncbi:hypothetical protein K3248_07920 [Candidatus Bartonella raoultii]|uniref:Major tropism determinant second domain-containing protein n=1 Tax=Bartonella raoultii TaxID=1457020 RepID=A0ABS7I6H9_9HYPH|nr:hypothetical protein [Bartonella raoultii]MBX4336513.1 hypothetical protein [Bartonella raoultii]